VIHHGDDDGDLRARRPPRLASPSPLSSQSNLTMQSQSSNCSLGMQGQRKATSGLRVACWQHVAQEHSDAHFRTGV